MGFSDIIDGWRYHHFLRGLVLVFTCLPVVYAADDTERSIGFTSAFSGSMLTGFIISIVLNTRLARLSRIADAPSLVWQFYVLACVMPLVFFSINGLFIEWWDESSLDYAQRMPSPAFGSAMFLESFRDGLKQSGLIIIPFLAAALCPVICQLVLLVRLKCGMRAAND